MKVTSSKTIYLSEKELKKIIADWLLKETSPCDDGYYQLFASNHSMLEFNQNGDLVIVIDGEIVEFNSEEK